MREMPERIFCGENGLFSAMQLLKEDIPTLGVQKDTEYVRKDLAITEHPDVQRLIGETVKLQAENVKLKEEVARLTAVTGLCCNNQLTLKKLKQAKEKD